MCSQSNQQKINCRRQNIKPYLPVIMILEFKRTQDPTPERSSRSMRQLAASCTTCNSILKIRIYDSDPRLPTNITINLRSKRSSTNFALPFPSVGSDNWKAGGICCDQNLTPFKMMTCIPHLSTLWSTSELSSKVHVIPTSSRSSLIQASSAPKTSAPNQAATITNHSWSSPTITQPYYLHVHNV